MKKLIVCLSLIGFLFLTVSLSGCGMGGSELVGSNPSTSQPTDPTQPASKDDPEKEIATLSTANFPDENKIEGNTIKVPEDYATIAEAVEAAEDGNIILLAKGSFPVVKDLKIKKNIQIIGSGTETTLTGPQESSLYILFYIEETNVIITNLKINAPKAVVFYFYNSKSIIKNVEIEESTVGISAGGSSIVKALENKISAEETIKSGDNAIVFAKKNALKGNGIYRNVSIASDGSLYARGNIIEAGENCAELITAEKNAKVDLGSENGRNTFILKNINGYLINNKTSKNISAQGNYWSKYIYKEMQAYPDPFAESANITKIYDRHDNSAYGVVDYKNFKVIPGEEDAHADKPDLTILDIYNEKGVLSIKISNIETTRVLNENGGLYIWIDDRLSWTYSFFTSADKSYLLPGGTSIVQPEVLSGEHKIKAIIDPDNVITELNENNNSMEKTLTFGH
jgi:hypothetical protein